MARTEPNLAEFIELGELLYQVSSARERPPVVWSEAAKRLREGLDRCELVASQRAADSLAKVRLKPDPQSGMFHPQHSQELETMTAPIRDVIYHEVQQKALAISDSHDLPATLVDLQGLDETQENLRRDALRCITAGAYRAAIVVMWSLGYDLVRRWVFDDEARRAEFNELLEKRTENHRGGLRQINEYRDFYKEGEDFVLQVCRDAGGPLNGFTSKTYTRLHSLLDERNNFAHANDDECNDDECKAYARRLVRAVTGEPFRE